MTDTLTQRMKRVSDLSGDCGFVIGVLQGLHLQSEMTAGQEAAIEAALSAMDRIETATWKRECDQTAELGGESQ